MLYPEMVKTNARYRGPRESRKQNNVNRDTVTNIVKLKNAFEKNKQERESIRQSIFTFYDNTQHDLLNETKHAALAVKGGEIR